MEPLAPWRDDLRMLGSHLTPLLAEESTASRYRRRAETGLAANVGDDAPQPPPLGRQRELRHGQLAAVCCGSG
ncbi:MAG: hypothetical protein F4X99_16515 [Gammaproteobacteria bacterium]|nr:hypothetical protein [Gammaproteobacteria bacterium]